MEHWKKIDGYDNYEVSNLGRVCNTKTGHMIYGTPNDYRRVVVRLSKNGKQKNFLMNRLVAQAFIPNPENKELVKHRDGDNENNKVSNLYWMSYAEIRALAGHSEATVRTYRINELGEEVEV